MISIYSNLENSYIVIRKSLTPLRKRQHIIIRATLDQLTTMLAVSPKLLNGEPGQNVSYGPWIERLPTDEV